jgi:cytochrome c-type biogenesis protein CcmE
MRLALKMSLIASFVAIAVGYLAYLGAASSWQYYLSVDEAAADHTDLLGKRVRVNGQVATGSLTIRNPRRATFDLAGKTHNLRVTCYCRLPDNLAEDMDVVVEGMLNADCIRCDRVITRCASKYQSVRTTASRASVDGVPISINR